MMAFDGSFWGSGTVVWVAADDAAVTVTLEGDGRFWAMLLDDADRVEELSRMLAGLPGSDAAAAHAAELLTEAGRRRERSP